MPERTPANWRLQKERYNLTGFRRGGGNPRPIEVSRDGVHWQTLQQPMQQAKPTSTPAPPSARSN